LRADWSRQQQIDKELRGGLITVNVFWRISRVLCVDKIQRFFPSTHNIEHGQGPICWALDMMMILMACLQSGNKYSYLNGYSSFDIFQKKQRSLSGQTSALDFCKSSSGALSSPPVVLDVGNDDIDNPPVVQEEVPPFKSSLVFFFKSLKYIIIFLVSQIRLSGITLHI